MKKKAALALALVLSLSSLASCGGNKTQAPADTGAQTEAATTEETGEAIETEGAGETTLEAVIDPTAGWGEYDSLIKEVKSTTDFAARVDLMHQAEDLLMQTGAILPIYFYNDVYMQKKELTGIYSNNYGFKYFMFAEAPDTTVKLNLASEPDSTDPALNSSVDGACLIVNTFSGLFTYNADGKVEADVVKDYTVSEDGMTYTFNLLPDLKWSDGSELNANDFVYAWNRAVDEKTAADYAYMFDVIATNDDGTLQIEASEDGQSMTVQLQSPCAYFLDLCAFPAYYPVKQASVEAASDWETNPGSWCKEAGYVSNGAYTVSAWKHDESLTMTKNPNYHKADAVKVESLNFMLSADDTVTYAAYNAGDLDFIDSVPNDEIANLLNNEEFHIADQLGTYYISFNVKSPLFEGKTPEQAAAMRKAFSLLIDREYIAENIGQTGQKTANTFVPAGMADGNGGEFKTNSGSYTYPDEATAGYFDPSAVDVDTAIELLTQAGFEFTEDGMLSDATPINFEYLTNENTGHVAIAEAVQSDLSEIGINMTIKTCDWNVFLDERKSGKYDIARNGWIADFNDPINMLEMWCTDSGNNDCQFGR